MCTQSSVLWFDYIQAFVIERLAPAIRIFAISFATMKNIVIQILRRFFAHFHLVQSSHATFVTVNRAVVIIHFVASHMLMAYEH